MLLLVQKMSSLPPILSGLCMSFVILSIQITQSIFMVSYGFVAFGHHSAKHVGQLVLDGDRKVVGDTYCFLKRLPGQVLSDLGLLLGVFVSRGMIVDFAIHEKGRNLQSGDGSGKNRPGNCQAG